MKNSNSVWYSKYAPKRIDEIVLNGLTAQSSRFLIRIASRQTGCNILLYGPPGTGKTTFANLIAYDKAVDAAVRHGSEITSANDVHSLKASSSHGTLFGQHRVIIIDDADLIEPKVQGGLRDAIDANSSTAWILTCNQKKKISEPVASRLIPVEFGYPSPESIKAYRQAIFARCMFILDAEGIQDPPEREVYEIVDSCYPDIRQTISQLQMRFESPEQTILLAS